MKPVDAFMIEITDENRAALVQAALSAYSNEPCRVCGEILTTEALQDAVFAGYSSDATSRAAHKKCWDAKIPQDQWAKQ